LGCREIQRKGAPMKKLLVSWAVAGVSMWLVSLLLGPNMEFANGWDVVWASALVGLLNAVLAPLLNLITCPILLLTLGLSRFLVNAVIILIAGSAVDGFDIAGFWWAVLAAVLISISTTVIGGMIKSDGGDRRR